MDIEPGLDGYLRHHHAIEETVRKPLFFIVGVAKSGTTWLQKLLDGHPDICCNGESHVGSSLIPGIMDLLAQHNKLICSKNKMLQHQDEGYPVFSNDMALYVAKTAMYTLLHAQQEGTDSLIIGEKTPDHLRHMEDITEHLVPGARFIHIVRDGRDAAVSGWHHIYREMPEWAQKNFPTLDGYVELFAQTWVTEIKIARQYGRRFPENYLEIKYEDLQESLKETLLTVLRYLDADDRVECINRCIENGSFKKLAGGRVKGEEDASSHFRKGIAGDWRNVFDDRCEKIFYQHAKELLIELGYECNPGHPG